MRLEYSSHRAHRELRFLQADARKKGPLEPSPYSVRYNDALDEFDRQLGYDEIEPEFDDEDDDQDDDDEAAGDQAVPAPADPPPSPAEESITQNEPKIAETAASAVPEAACDNTRAPATSLTTSDAWLQARIVRDTQDRIADAKLDAEET
jgi:hypothetical protein